MAKPVHNANQEWSKWPRCPSKCVLLIRYLLTYAVTGPRQKSFSLAKTLPGEDDKITTLVDDSDDVSSGDLPDLRPWKASKSRTSVSRPRARTQSKDPKTHSNESAAQHSGKSAGWKYSPREHNSRLAKMLFSKENKKYDQSSGLTEQQRRERTSGLQRACNNIEQCQTRITSGQCAILEGVRDVGKKRSEMVVDCKLFASAYSK